MEFHELCHDSLIKFHTDTDCFISQHYMHGGSDADAIAMDSDGSTMEYDYLSLPIVDSRWNGLRGITDVFASAEVCLSSEAFQCPTNHLRWMTRVEALISGKSPPVHFASGLASMPLKLLARTSSK